MSEESLIKQLEAKLRGAVSAGEPMSRHTTFRVGGPCVALVEPEDARDLAAALEFLRGEGVKHIVIGRGSNLLFPDAGYDGFVLRIGRGMSEIKVDGVMVEAGAGALLHELVVKAVESGLEGIESLAGIPGTVGGAVWMNAGAFETSVSGPLESVCVIGADGAERREPKREADFRYRWSVYQERPEEVITSARFELRAGDPEALKDRVRGTLERRRAKQPLELPSAGSFFRNPGGGPAGRLIDQAGLKGLRVGGAMVSEKHANFIVNAGGATCADILELSRSVIAKVRELYGVSLEPEVRIVC